MQKRKPGQPHKGWKSAARVSKRERRRYPIGEIALMAEADGYVMVRRPGRMPFVLSSQSWRYLPLA